MAFREPDDRVVLALGIGPQLWAYRSKAVEALGTHRPPMELLLTEEDLRFVPSTLEIHKKVMLFSLLLVLPHRGRGATMKDPQGSDTVYRYNDYGTIMSVLNDEPFKLEIPSPGVADRRDILATPMNVSSGRLPNFSSQLIRSSIPSTGLLPVTQAGLRPNPTPGLESGTPLPTQGLDSSDEEDEMAPPQASVPPTVLYRSQRRGSTETYRAAPYGVRDNTSCEPTQTMTPHHFDSQPESTSELQPTAMMRDASQTTNAWYPLPESRSTLLSRECNDRTPWLNSARLIIERSSVPPTIPVTDRQPTELIGMTTPLLAPVEDSQNDNHRRFSFMSEDFNDNGGDIEISIDVRPEPESPKGFLDLDISPEDVHVFEDLTTEEGRLRRARRLRDQAYREALEARAAKQYEQWKRDR
eukprot:Blabericola_migrator_1__2789@NODE_1799_length_3777_cov_220_658760_g849_i2_p1_GENE_NODE_1799_length_3777_cov_220_658760_g849_i2NODE_1799_length_3777_cov_220_658760_g849_i2_p1_ORF_typecomplete_len413_score69_97_NODE_1799_length_3777_cov_220_658760_g849_i2861324